MDSKPEIGVAKRYIIIDFSRTLYIKILPEIE